MAFRDWFRGEDTAPREGLLQTRALARIDEVAWMAATGATTPADIRGLPAVTGARRLIASTIDQIPLTVTRGDVPTWLADPRTLRDDGRGMDLGDMIQYTVDSMILHGRAYWLCRPFGESAWALGVLSPDFVQPYLVDRLDGTVENAFRVRGADVAAVPPRRVRRLTEEQRAKLTREQRAKLDEPRILHIPYVVTVDCPAGSTPLTEAAQALRGFATTERHIAELFDQGTWQGGVLSTAHDITITQAQQWQEAFITARRGGKIPVLGNGLEYRNETPNSRDLQMVEARQFNQSAVWALLGIPQAYMGSSMMGGQSSLSYANAQDNRRQFADNCLRAFTTQIEEAVSRLLPGAYAGEAPMQARFDFTEWEGRDDSGNTAVAGAAAAPA